MLKLFDALAVLAAPQDAPPTLANEALFTVRQRVDEIIAHYDEVRETFGERTLAPGPDEVEGRIVPGRWFEGEAYKSTPRVGTYWRHFRGGFYIIKEISKREKTQETEVVYERVDPRTARLTGEVWSRPVSEWSEHDLAKGGLHFSVHRFEPSWLPNEHRAESVDEAAERPSKAPAVKHLRRGAP